MLWRNQTIVPRRKGSSKPGNEAYAMDVAQSGVGVASQYSSPTFQSHIPVENPVQRLETPILCLVLSQSPGLHSNIHAVTRLLFQTKVSMNLCRNVSEKANRALYYDYYYHWNSFLRHLQGKVWKGNILLQTKICPNVRFRSITMFLYNDWEICDCMHVPIPRAITDDSKYLWLLQNWWLS